jgi:hypothetical protein
LPAPDTGSGAGAGAEVRRDRLSPPPSSQIVPGHPKCSKQFTSAQSPEALCNTVVPLEHFFLLKLLEINISVINMTFFIFDQQNPCSKIGARALSTAMVKMKGNLSGNYYLEKNNYPEKDTMVCPLGTSLNL